MRYFKKSLCYVLMFVLMFAIIPIHAARGAQAANYFIPDDGSLAATANIALTNSTSLSRSTVKVYNTNLMSISGVYQQVTSSSMKLTVDQLIFDSKTNTWTTVPGNSMNMPIVGSANNKFSVTGVQLFPGYNRITMSGTQGAATNTDYFYVLYDTAPLANSLQVLANNQAYDLNEGSGLVVTTNSILIQGTTSNVKTVTINGQVFSTFGTGSFYSSALTLQPGLNNFTITLANLSDSITLKRTVYYYDPTNPFTRVDLKEGETQSLIGATPTFTGNNSSVDVNLEFLLPYNSTSFQSDLTAGTSSIQFTPNSGSTITPTVTVNSETVITNTYGANAYRLVNAKATYNLGSSPALSQTLGIQIDYMSSTPQHVSFAHTYGFNLTWGQAQITNVLLLTDSTNNATDPVASSIDDNTPSVALDGQSVNNSTIYVIVNTSDNSDPGTSGLDVTLQTFGSVSSGTITVAQDFGQAHGSTKNTGYVFKLTGVPEGNQVLGFSISGGPTFTAKVNYVSKNYVTFDNLTDGQVMYLDSSNGTTLKVPFSGSIIGFGNRLLTPVQLVINGVDKSILLPATWTPDSSGNYVIPQTDLVVDRTNGPLFFGQNDIKLYVNYSDGSTGILRQYVKEVQFYIIDTNIPAFGVSARPLTPPASSTSVRGSLSSTNPADYLPASPELQMQGTYYSTTLDTIDLFFEGSGADSVTVSNGSATTPTIYSATIGTTITTNISNTAASVDHYANSSNPKSDFRFRLNSIPINLGTTVFTIVLSNNNGGTSTQTVEVHRINASYRLLSPIMNTGNQIIVNKNFVLFDVEAKGATDVQINGVSATPRTDVPDRYTYTLTGLKGDKDNKVNLVVKRSTGDVKDTVTIRYVTDPAVGSMYMEPLSTKHSIFNKDIQLTFPKNTVLRRTTDGKIQPSGDLLFGIADPSNGNTELINDYGQKLGSVNDSRTPNEASVIQVSSLSTYFMSQYGRDHFTTVSPYYWISAGLAENGNIGDSTYRPATGGLAPYSTEGAYSQYSNNAQRKISPSQRGTITLKFNSEVVDQAGTSVSVFYLDDGALSGGIPTWKNIGGVVDTKNNTITAPFDNFGFYMVGKLKYSFDDITNHGWARDILQALYSKGYMNALYNGAFGANDDITRGEFAAVMVRSLGLKLTTDENPNNRTFVDVLPGAHPTTWSYEEIETAARAGIVQGQNNGVFAPGQPISRQDAAVMIGRALSLKLAVNDDKLKAKVEKIFQGDGTDIDHYALPSVDALYSAGIMVGSTNGADTTNSKAKPPLYFNPQAYMTRAEAGQIAVRLLQKYLKALPTNLS